MSVLPEADDWVRIFALETPIFELVARGTAVYFGVLILMRVMPRRTGGQLATMDLILVVLIANAAAPAFGSYTSVVDALLTIVTVMGWDYFVNALSYRARFFERLVSAPPLQVIRDGQLLRRNMRREFLTEEELLSHLRELGIDDIKEVKAAYVEGEGHVTAIRFKGSEQERG